MRTSVPFIIMLRMSAPGAKVIDGAHSFYRAVKRRPGSGVPRSAEISVGASFCKILITQSLKWII